MTDQYADGHTVRIDWKVEHVSSRGCTRSCVTDLIFMTWNFFNTWLQMKLYSPNKWPNARINSIFFFVFISNNSLIVNISLAVIRFWIGYPTVIPRRGIS